MASQPLQRASPVLATADAETSGQKIGNAARVGVVDLTTADFRHQWHFELTITARRA